MSEEINSDVLFDLAQLKEAVEHDRLIWPWSQAHKDALVLAAKFVIDHFEGDTSQNGQPSQNREVSL